MEAEVKKQTTREEQIARLFSIFSEMISDKREDIETGIEDGTYEEEDNEETLKELDDLDKEIEQFLQSSPEIWVMVEGGMIQGISANQSVAVNIYDTDCEENDNEYVENNGTSQQWDAEIKRMDASREICAIY